jgi:hypothetical protein
MERLAASSAEVSYEIARRASPVIARPEGSSHSQEAPREAPVLLFPTVDPRLSRHPGRSGKSQSRHPRLYSSCLHIA